MHLFQGGSRLRFIHLDHLSIVLDIVTRGQRVDATSKRGFNNSYFYRTHQSPLCLREIIRPSILKAKLIEYIWNEYISKPSDNLEH